MQLSDPVPALRCRQTWVTRQTAFEQELIEFLVVEGAEFRRQATKCPDKPELRGDDIDDETEPSLLRKVEPILGFTLHLNERVSRREKVSVQALAAIGCKREVAGPVCGLESAAQQITASPDMFRPWHDKISEDHTGPGLEALQSAFFDQFIAEPTESKSGLVVAEVRSCYDAKPYIGEA